MIRDRAPEIPLDGVLADNMRYGIIYVGHDQNKGANVYRFSDDIIDDHLVLKL